MRDSITLFVAVTLCLLLCLPAKSLDKIWNSSSTSLTSVAKKLATLPEVLSIKFQSGNQSNIGVEPVEIHLIAQSRPDHYSLDWSNFENTKSLLEIYNATGNLLNKIDAQSADNQKDILVEEIKLEPGIYYAYMALSTNQSTQKGYAKFVVK